MALLALALALAAGEGGGGGRKLDDPAQFFIIVLYHVLQVKV